MAGRLEMGRGVAIARGVAAADMPALQALPQVDPGVAELEALLAALGALIARRRDRGKVGARSGHDRYFVRYFFTYAMPSVALCIAFTAKLPPCSTKKCFMPDKAVSGQILV